MSKPAVDIREPREGDAEALAANLRPQDIDELDALHGPGHALRVIRDSLRLSSAAWVGTVDGEVACIFGVAAINMLSGLGAPWLLGTPLIDRNRGAFIRRNPPYIRRMLALYPHLVNLVDARNLRSIAWLKRLGFTIHGTQRVGVAGLPFHVFTMDA